MSFLSLVAIKQHWSSVELIHALGRGREGRLDASEDLFSSELQDSVGDRDRATPASREVLGRVTIYPCSRESGCIWAI